MSGVSGRMIDRYLERRATLEERWPLLLGCQSMLGVQQAVVIPALAEEGWLLATLATLSRSPRCDLARTVVICVVNNRPPGSATTEQIASNQRTLAGLRCLLRGGRARSGTSPAWARRLRLAVVDAASAGRELPADQGVGLARKIGLDRGLQLLVDLGVQRPVLLCLDADTLVDARYLGAVSRFFAGGGDTAGDHRWGGVVGYRHLLPGPRALRAAILSYELFLRYHELGLRYAGSPYALTAIGSTIVCSGRAYAAVAGMNRRRAGEDFYFLQQLVRTGSVQRVPGAMVYPSARPSDRVPFGTGARVRRVLAALAGDPAGGIASAHRVYHPESYQLVRRLLSLLRRCAVDATMPAAAVIAEAQAIAPAAARFLEQQRFVRVLEAMRGSARDARQLARQLDGWFDGLKTLRLVHRLRDSGDYPEQDLFEALARIGVMVGDPALSALAAQCTSRDLAAQQALLEASRRATSDRVPVA